MRTDDKRATLPEVYELHGIVAQQLSADLMDPERRSPALIAAAIKFLKDQGVTAIPEKSEDVKKLLASLPFQQLEEEDEVLNG